MKIAILIKSIPGRISLLWVLISLEHALNNYEYRIYLADAEPLDAWKNKLYEQLTEQGHLVEVWSEDVSATQARNRLLNKIEDEDVVLRMDDDFELGGEFRIDAMLSVLQARPDISFCSDMERQIGPGKGVDSGTIRRQGGLIEFTDNGPLVHWRNNHEWKFHIADQIRYAEIEFTRNLLLLRRECFSDVQWDENLSFEGEHADFLLSLKQAGHRGAFTPDSIHLHRDDLKALAVNLSEDRIRRADEWVSRAGIVFQRKWGSRKVLSEPQKTGFVRRFFKIIG